MQRLKLAGTREIASCVWVHPNNEKRATILGTPWRQLLVLVGSVRWFAFSPGHYFLMFDRQRAIMGRHFPVMLA
jgi:hypothetical protein